MNADPITVHKLNRLEPTLEISKEYLVACLREQWFIQGGLSISFHVKFPYIL